VVAWNVAQKYADAHDMKFRTPALAPRDPKNRADQFEQRALDIFQKDPSVKEYDERRFENGEEVLRYAQPVRITNDCLFGHGDPVGAKDPFGYTKEGMKVGDLRGAFVIRASTAGLVTNAYANSLAMFILSFLTLLAAAGAIFLQVRKLVVKPLSASLRMANAIAANDLALDDLALQSSDEIAEATIALNTMKNNLGRTVEAIADTAEHVASAGEQLTATSQQIATHSEGTSSQLSVVAESTQQVNHSLQSISAGAGQMTSTIQSIASNAHDAAMMAAGAVHTVQAANAAVGKLRKSSEEIGEVIKVVTSIAQQTNLLALNSTIEASRAGEPNSN
jgi:methyl-accepting chemotaxis protein